MALRVEADGSGIFGLLASGRRVTSVCFGSLRDVVLRG